MDGYNKGNKNPDHILHAGDLYQNETYHLLIDRFGWENVCILSAGWGLIGSDYLLPYYDITFSKLADSCKQRKKADKYNDFNHLFLEGTILENDPIYIFAGVDYLPLFYKLTKHIPIPKFIFYKSENINNVYGYQYIKYLTTQSTNWHYSCAQDFANGKLGI